MSKPIIQLPEHLANLIAAGEVVERPASVVKELVENSIDANAKTIKITLENGGLKYISVLDDGDGIDKEQIPIALKRHATSKIASEIDLFEISSLGFRGEALPSIASVSKLIISSNPGLKHGYYYEFHYGKLKSNDVIALPKGTQVEVIDLFENTPARFKHLSSVSTELSHILDYISKCAFAFPGLRFSVINNQKNVFSTSGNESLLDAINEVYGPTIASKMMPFMASNNLYQLSGFISNNEVFKSNRQSINLLVNGRVIKNNNLGHGITDAYKSILPIGKYPIVVLSINCEPSIIDVNVHPSKLEIRFTDENFLRNLITKSIQKTLQENELLKYRKESPTNHINANFEFLADSPACNPVEKEVEEENLSFDCLWKQLLTTSVTPVIEEEKSNLVDWKEDDVYITETPKLQFNEPARHFFQKFRYIGQFHKTYLLLEDEETLYLIDQHAAMERVMYEHILRQFDKIEHNLYELLVPITIELSHSEIELLINHQQNLKQLGLDVELFGPTSVIVRTVPSYFPRGLEVEFIMDIFNHVNTSQKTGHKIMLDGLAQQLSCKRSIKANMNITIDEVKTLLTDLDACEMPYTCPHGRPTLISFTTYQLEKMFKRVA